MQKEIALADSKQKVLDSGDAIIKVDTEGMEPHMGMAIRSLIENMRVSAGAQGQEFLLGM